MGEPVARVGDRGVGICPNHGSPLVYTTTFNTGSPTATADGIPVCVVGSTGVSTCGHNTTALTGSSLCSSGGLGYHRVNDTGQNFGTYTVTTGSPTVSAN